MRATGKRAGGSDAHGTGSRSATLLGPLLALFGACGGDPGSSNEPRWIDLAAGFEPRPLIELARRWAQEHPDPPVRVRPHHEYGQVWIETRLVASAWSAGATPGEWTTTRPTGGAFERVPGGPVRVAAGERELTRHFPGEPLEPGQFDLAGDRLRILLEPEEPRPKAVDFGVRIDHGAAFDGTWRVRAAGRVADGIPVWSGERASVTLDLPAHSSLRLVTLWNGRPSAEDAAPVFRVVLDGRTLLEHRDGEETAHTIELPASRVAGARLDFEVESPVAGQGLFLVPRVGPRDAGSPRERPWGAGRPDLVLFLADTLRADVLGVGGGEDGLTPNLDELAERSVVFTNARATGSWTLPSIASILTGLAPGQHGATDEDLTLSYDLVTLGEWLGQHGYRTAAVTDAAFFSQGFGLDQGFQWFEEHAFPDWDLARTLRKARAVLEHDDGRPLFLVVHTYRTHAPYRAGGLGAEDDGAWRSLLIEGRRQLPDEPGVRRAILERLCLAFAEEFRALYLEGVRELDHAFGTFAAELERSGRLERGLLVFTSDHGEAFGENGDVFHGGALWDVKLRVPLLVTGGGLAPARREDPVSLLELAPTLVDLAGVERLASWRGPSLLEAPRTEARLAFQLREHDRALAIVDGSRKVLAAPDPEALAAGRYEAAFDLARDPGEQTKLEPAPWAAELCRRLSSRVETLLVPAATPGQLGPAARRRPDLAAIGYGGE